MTRALLEQALSLSGYYESTWVGDLGDLEKLVQVAIEAIRAELAQPQSEPVAWLGAKTLYFNRAFALSNGEQYLQPLYLHPAHTEEDVQSILRNRRVEFSEYEAHVRRILGVPA